MTAERGGKSRRTAQPDLLASLPDERPAHGIDPAAFEEVRIAVQNIQTRMAGLNFSWRAILAPWTVFVFILGTAFESRTVLLHQWLWAS